MIKRLEQAEAEILRARQIASELLEAAEAVLSDIDALIAESEGVYGLHGNGDLAPWDELTEGGPYEEWLISLETLHAAIAKARGEEK
jgi:predicted Rdx family selenoprotein